MYTTIIHEARRILDISLHEYCYCDIIYHLSNNPKSKCYGWANISHTSIGLLLDLSKQSIININKKLQDKGIIEVNGIYKRTTQKWYTAVYEYDFKMNDTIENICCYYCGASVLEVKLEVEHFLPVLQGGKTEKKNLVLSCDKCIVKKGSLTGEEFVEILHQENKISGKESLPFDPSSKHQSGQNDSKESLPQSPKSCNIGKEICEIGKESLPNTNRYLIHTDNDKELSLDIENINDMFIKKFNEARNQKIRKLDSKTERQLKNLLKDGNSIDDIITALKNAMSIKTHIESGFMYLTPEFITRSDKFTLYHAGNFKCNAGHTSGKDSDY